jgi:hypothetical protein
MRFHPKVFLTVLALIPASGYATTPACAGYTGWVEQTNPPTDAAGLANTNYPEGSSTTYWSTTLTAPIGTTVTVHGQYPMARFMALELYTGNMLVDDINDINIQPDPGQNNPYVSGTANGTYTAYVVFGVAPNPPAANTIYTGTLTSVGFLYRIYHATNPNDPAAGATDPQIPLITVNGDVLTNCPVQPYLPAYSTPWLRLDLGNWIGTPPGPHESLPATNPPAIAITNPYTAHYFPNGADFYIGVFLSRQFLAPNTSDQIFVFRFLAPTFPNTRAGQPVYTPSQVRFWSLCTDDPYTTNVNRCIPDDESTISSTGYVTFVISDPGSAPSSTALTKFGAEWLAWGALYSSSDVVYGLGGRAFGVNTPVQYYNLLIYRQTLASSSFTKSMANISLLPAAQQPAAMAPYWPSYGYCTTAAFESVGAACVLQK